MLRREYSSLLALIMIFATLEVARGFAVYHRWMLNPVWIVLVCASALLACVLRFLKRHTRLLALPGH